MIKIEVSGTTDGLLSAKEYKELIGVG
jgi:hypothetical protein